MGGVGKNVPVFDFNRVFSRAQKGGVTPMGQQGLQMAQTMQMGLTGSINVDQRTNVGYRATAASMKSQDRWRP